MEFIENGDTPRLVFYLRNTADDSDATGKTVTPTISKNGGSFANVTDGNATAIANGWYYTDLTATETGTDGPLIFRVTETGCYDWLQVFTVGASLPAKPADSETFPSSHTVTEWQTGADVVLRRDLSEVRSATHTGIDALSTRSPLDAFSKQINLVVSSGGTVTIYQEDDTTAAYTQPINASAADGAPTSLDGATKS